METTHTQTPMVMIWDSQKETFSPRAAPPSAISEQNRKRAPTIGSPRREQFNRRYSNPESVLDFGDFLRDIDREPRRRFNRPGSMDMASNSDSTLDLRATLASMDDELAQNDIRASTPRPSSPQRTGPKSSFKSVLKEMLGGGGNNKDETNKKDTIVLPYGRGGVARGRVNAKPTTKPDPYLAHIQSPGAPPPAGHSMLPTTSIPRSNRPTHLESRPMPIYGAPDGYWSNPNQVQEIYYHQSPIYPPSKYSHSDQFRQGQSSRVLEHLRTARHSAPSPSPTSSSTSTNSSDNVGLVPSHRLTGPSQLSAPQARKTDAGEQTETSKKPSRTSHRAIGEASTYRGRSHSLTSPDEPKTPASKPGGGPGVFLHPAQAELEAKMAHQKRMKMEKMEASGVRVAVTPVEEPDEEVDTLPYRRQDDLLSVSEAEVDDVVSLSGFPLPPLHLPDQRDTMESIAARMESPTIPHSMISDPNDTYTSFAGVPHFPERYRPRHQTSLPTMVSPHSQWNTQAPVPHGERSRPSHLPAPPALPPPPTPQQARAFDFLQAGAYTRSDRSQVSSASLPVMPASLTGYDHGHMFRRGSAPGGSDFHPLSIPHQYNAFPYAPSSPITPPAFASDTFNIPAYSPTSGSVLPHSLEEMLALENQTKALARERAILEERVRDLVWLVNNLEGTGN
ncbi:hypothetical protein FRC03_011318 [Tulasnella sp. 419]|nr:hypothetical protein FRC03_011318 [Tulasnella sp. 419]